MVISPESSLQQPKEQAFSKLSGEDHSTQPPHWQEVLLSIRLVFLVVTK